LKINWKKIPAKDDPAVPVGDILAIIEHFGASKIIELYGRGETLEPLIDIELALTHIPYNEVEAHQMWDIAFPLKGSGFHYPLDVLLKIVKNQLTAENINHEFAKLFAKNIDKLCFILKPLPASKLQFSKLQVFQLFRLIVRMENPIATLAIVKSDILKHASDLFFKYSGHSIFLAEFLDFVEYLLNQTAKAENGSNTVSTLLSQLFVELKFLERLMVKFKTESKKSIPARTGNFGHFTKIVNIVQQVAATSATVQRSIQGVTGWSMFVKGPLEEVNALNKVPDYLKPTGSPRKKGEIVGDPGFDDI